MLAYLFVTSFVLHILDYAFKIFIAYHGLLLDMPSLCPWLILKNSGDSLITFGFSFFGVMTLQGFLTMQFLGLYGVFICQLFALLIFWLVLFISAGPFIFNGVTSHAILFKWFTVSSHIVVNFELYFDLVSISFSLLTVSIALFVLIYAFTYFRYEPNVDRLILFLSAFVWSMSLLVLSGNMYVLLLGWELIGLTSFLLINFWATRVGTFKAGFKAFTFNKLSDASLIMGVVLMSLVFQDLSLPTILTECAVHNTTCVGGEAKIRSFEVIAGFLFFSASIKSAQIIGHLWLPDSMEAPVPASALIHSATLVSAGIFLILRLYPLFEQTWIFHNIAPVVGAITAAYGGLVAAYQTDVKRLLAYSTISHCGFLVVLASLGSVEHTLMYLYIHGFFKAISFLCVGNVIRFAKNYQDLRRMGNFWKALPVELALLSLALLNLSGAPFFWGFVCKHLVLASVSNFWFNSIVWSFVLVGALTGPLYSYRLVSYIFFDTAKSRKSILLGPGRRSLSSIHNANTPLMGWLSIVGLLVLAYVLIYIVAHSLVWGDNISGDSVAALQVNQAAHASPLARAPTFNFALFNWASLIVWVCSISLRWGCEYNSDKVLNNLLNLAITAPFFFICLRLF